MLLENNIAFFQETIRLIEKIQLSPKMISVCALEKSLWLAVMF